MDSATIGLILFGVSVLTAILSWLWPKMEGVKDTMKRSPVKAGQRHTSLSDAHRKEEEIESAAHVLAGRWALERVIGRGGMGRVWEGSDKRTGARIAVKTIEAPDKETRKVLKDIYLAEARALSRLRHPNVVDFLEAAPDGEGVALVFAFVSGKTVQQMLAEDKRLPWEPTRAIFSAVAKALIAAHKEGVVHRDLKPANIMVSSDGIVKVMDFGIARLLTPDPHAVGADALKSSSPVTSLRTSTMAGTPAYMPPEAATGLITTRGDLYSLGVCLYEALTGRLPYGPDGWSPATDPLRYALRDFVPSLPPAAEVVVDELLVPDPDKRMADAETLLKRLLAI